MTVVSEWCPAVANLANDGRVCKTRPRKRLGVKEIEELTKVNGVRIPVQEKCVRIGVEGKGAVEPSISCPIRGKEIRNINWEQDKEIREANAYISSKMGSPVCNQPRNLALGLRAIRRYVAARCQTSITVSNEHYFLIATVRDNLVHKRLYFVPLMTQAAHIVIIPQVVSKARCVKVRRRISNAGIAALGDRQGHLVRRTVAFRIYFSCEVIRKGMIELSAIRPGKRILQEMSCLTETSFC